MATYSYECTECGYKFDINKSMTECNTQENCPKCHKLAKKTITIPNGFILKGEGFYQNDYK